MLLLYRGEIFALIQFALYGASDFLIQAPNLVDFELDALSKLFLVPIEIFFYLVGVWLFGLFSLVLLAASEEVFVFVVPYLLSKGLVLVESEPNRFCDEYRSSQCAFEQLIDALIGIGWLVILIFNTNMLY